MSSDIRSYTTVELQASEEKVKDIIDALTNASGEPVGIEFADDDAGIHIVRSHADPGIVFIQVTGLVVAV